MRNKEKQIGIIMTAIMSIAMGVVASVYVVLSPDAKAGPFPVVCLLNVVESLIVGFIFAFLVPLSKLGRALTMRFKAYPPGIKFTLLNCLPMAVGNSVVVGAIVSFINVFIAHSKMPNAAEVPLLGMWLKSFLPILVPGIVISYILSVLLSPLVVKKVGMRL